MFFLIKSWNSFRHFLSLNLTQSWLLLKDLCCAQIWRNVLFAISSCLNHWELMSLASQTVTEMYFSYLNWDFFPFSRTRISCCSVSSSPTEMCSICGYAGPGFVAFVGFPIPQLLLGVIFQGNQTTCMKRSSFYRGYKSENQISKPIRSVCKIRMPIFWVKAWGNPLWLSDTILTT